MTISLSEAGKRYNSDWIFRKLSYTFTPGRAYAITGTNGSGKSTLLQVIAGATVASEGKIEYSLNGKTIAPEEVYRELALCAPYLELVEEMTALEFLRFHERFKPFYTGQSILDILKTVGLEHAAHKQIRYFSSGMKQRVRLAQAVFSSTQCLFLDEPCANLDDEGIVLYHRLIRDYRHNRLVIVCSNDPQEYGFCTEILRMGKQELSS